MKIEEFANSPPNSDREIDMKIEEFAEFANSPPNSQIANPNSDGLTPKQQRFVEEYLKDVNGKASCERMGVRPASAAAMAHEFLQRPQVRAAIERARERVIVKVGKSLEEIAMKIEEFAFSPPNSQIANSVDYVKNADRLKGLELLLRLKGAFVDKMEVSGRNGGPINMAQMSWVSMITQERERIRESEALPPMTPDDPR